MLFKAIKARRLLELFFTWPVQDIKLGLVDSLGVAGLEQDTHQIIETFMTSYPVFFDKRFHALTSSLSLGSFIREVY